MIDPDKRRYMKQNRKISPVQENVIDMLLDSGQSQRSAYQYLINSHGGQENVCCIRSDMKNMLNKKRKINMVHGEATVLHRGLGLNRNKIPVFFYDMQVDEFEAITSIFWADSGMISDYALFGDFVSFDTTYRTNQAHRPLGNNIYCCLVFSIFN